MGSRGMFERSEVVDSGERRIVSVFSEMKERSEDRCSFDRKNRNALLVVSCVLVVNGGLATRSTAPVGGVGTTSVPTSSTFNT